ncbi:hypothetical protein P4361_02725 [Fictibacillus sp. B-59209]|uniref:hypothetical protein n=1 Tax=Fictibacillus sp. B-59209 TaxID=3024873 RepID=UPI002E2265C3|nr:hypothetical protein [Fictibacillus sp. B-59209]
MKPIGAAADLSFSDSRFDTVIDYTNQTIKINDDKAVEKDLTNALLVTEKAVKNKNQKGLLIAHRIFYDLAILYNDYDEFGYIKYGNGYSEKAAEEYLKK